MPQSLSDILVHMVFSTRDRVPYLAHNEIGPMHAYLASVARTANCECYRVGGVADHVHLALQLPRTLTVAQLTLELKTASSKWVKSEYPGLRDFSWQRGYGAFSIGRSNLENLISYIDRQEERHDSKSFQEEYLELLQELGVPYDLKYLWE